MYEEPPFINEVPPGETKIWRYIDFPQLVSILERDSLWFTRSDKFDDPFEGSMPIANTQTREDRYNRKQPEQTAEQHAGAVRTAEILPEVHKFQRHFTYVNCWHMSDAESAAIWRPYDKEGKTLAIRSTIKRFVEATRTSTYPVNFGKVEYIDYDDKMVSDLALQAPFFHKRESFEHECEFRALINTQFRKEEGHQFEHVDDDGQVLDVSSIPETDPGEYVSVNIDTLIESIWLSPVIDDWLGELVRMVTDRYGVSAEVIPSSLGDDPDF